MLVDTGANVTILSKKFVHDFTPELVHRIEPVNINLITATGESSPFLGQLNVDIGLGSKFYPHSVLIADIPGEGILGMDFLLTHNCDVLLSKNKLKLSGETIQCFQFASSAKTCCRICIQETIMVPANSEIIVSGEPTSPIFKGSIGLIEPNEEFIEKSGLLMARAIVKSNSYDIPLRIMNVQDQPCTLYKGTLVAQYNKINENDIQSYEIVFSIDKDQINSSKEKELPAHLKDVFES